MDSHKQKKASRKIVELFDIFRTAVNEVLRSYSTLGIEAALRRRTRLTPPHVSKITGDFEAYGTATVLSLVPKGRARRTLRLLAGYCGEHRFILSISHSAIAGMLNITV